MDKGICFIINKCNFENSLIEKIKSTLLKNGYSPWIAEEVSSFNVDMLEHRILKPLKDAEFIIVLLSPVGEDKKDANFNVAFEFGYARGIGQKVILLFDGDLKELPADISRDYAISLQNPELLSKIETLIINIEEQKEKRLEKLPQELLNLFIDKATVNDFDEFARLLDEFSSSFRLLDNQIICAVILNNIEGNSQKLSSGKSSLTFLSALNNIFRYDKSKTSKNLNKQILKNLIYTLNNTKDISIAKECLNLFIKTDDTNTIKSIIDFLISKYPENFGEERLSFPLMNFAANCSIEYCITFLSELTKIKNTHQISKEKSDNLESIRHQLVKVITVTY